MGVVTADTIASAVPAVDSTIVQLKRLEFRDLSLAQRLEWIFVLTRHDDTESGDVFLKDFKHRFVHPFRSEVDSRTHIPQIQVAGSCINSLLEKRNACFTP